MRRLMIAIASSAFMACGSGAPQPPVVAPSPGETITGAERIGWDQAAADLVELGTIRYALYVDGTRSELARVRCAPSAGAVRFACSAPLPTLAPGTHSLQIASFVVDGGSTLESARSAALSVRVLAATAGAPAGERASARSVAADAAIDPAAPADAALAPDGRLFVVERDARIRSAAADGRGAQPAAVIDGAPADAQAIGIALDPAFAQTHLVYVLLAAAGSDRTATFVVLRLREAAGTFADAAVILDGVAASASPAGALRFGPDGKLYAAFDNGGDPRRAGDAASYNGKVLRLNPDGTTPRDQPRGSPVVAGDLAAPTGLAWDVDRGAMWIVDRGAGGRGSLDRVSAGGVERYALAADTVPTSIAASADAVPMLWIGSNAGARLLRIALDARTGRPTGTERLLIDEPHGVRAIAAAPGGGVLAITATRVVHVAAPDPQSG